MMLSKKYLYPFIFLAFLSLTFSFFVIWKSRPSSSPQKFTPSKELSKPRIPLTLKVKNPEFSVKLDSSYQDQDTFFVFYKEKLVGSITIQADLSRRIRQPAEQADLSRRSQLAKAEYELAVFKRTPKALYLGLTQTGIGETATPFWGPTILYRLDENNQIFEKMADLTLKTDQGVETKGFINDIAHNDSSFVYVNGTEIHSVTLNLQKNKETVYKPDIELDAIGEAKIATDGKIAYVGVKIDHINGDLQLQKAVIITIDPKTNKQQIFKQSDQPGKYSLLGWLNHKPTYQFIPE